MTTQNLGQSLKEKREERGLSLKDVASALRVRSDSLEQIESGDYDVNDVYISGYIRLYSKYLGINIEAEDIECDQRNKSSVDNVDERLQENDVVVGGSPNLRVVVVSFAMVLVSVFFVIFFFDKGNDRYDVSYINKLNLSAQDRVVIKENTQTYVVHKHKDPLVIRASDSVEVDILDSENHLLERVYLRVGEVIPFPIKERSTIVRSNIPDAIEISIKN